MGRIKSSLNEAGVVTIEYCGFYSVTERNGADFLTLELVLYSRSTIITRFPGSWIALGF